MSNFYPKLKRGQMDGFINLIENILKDKKSSNSDKVNKIRYWFNLKEEL